MTNASSGTASPSRTPHSAGRFSIRLPRPLWFALAAAVLVVVAAALLIGLPIYRQQFAVREIERVGGQVWTSQPIGPEWLRKQLGNERAKLLDDVTGVHLQSSRATDETLALLRRLSSLQRLNLIGAPVTDAGLAHLKDLTSLQMLLLSATRVTDEGLVHLQPLAGLKLLMLDGTQVSDAGLRHLTQMNDLEWLGVADTAVTDQGIAELQRSLPRLRVYRYFFSLPRAGQTYLSTSDIVISGAEGIPDIALIVQLRDSRNVIWQSGSAVSKAGGAWMTQLTSIEPWRPGNYSCEFGHPFGYLSAVPLKIVDDPAFLAAGRLNAVARLPTASLVQFPKTTLLDCNVDDVEVDRAAAEEDNPSTRSATPILPGQTFEVVGELDVRIPPKDGYAPVVLQIITVRSGPGGEPQELIVNEDSVFPLTATSGGVEFRKVLVAPRVPGQYLLQAHYRRSMVGETEIVVDDPEGADKP